MTLRIEITVPEALVADGTGSAYLGRAMSTLGYLRGSTALTEEIVKLAPAFGRAQPDEGAADPDAEDAEDNDAGSAQQSLDSAEAGLASVAALPKRERGKPGEGRKRRTNAEIAEDEAADKAEFLLADATARQAGKNLDGTERRETVETAQISTGEERVGPEDDAETQAQDKADEAAETAPADGETKPASLDDIRGALGEYVKQFGMAAAQEDGPKLIELVCGDGIKQISKIPDDKVDKVLGGVREMIAKNPYKREAV